MTDDVWIKSDTNGRGVYHIDSECSHLHIGEHGIRKIAKGAIDLPPCKYCADKSFNASEVNSNTGPYLSAKLAKMSPDELP